MSSNVPDTLENNIVLIPTNSSFNDVVEMLDQNKQVLDTASFRKVAGMMNYNKSIVKSGRYKINPSWSNRSLIRHLRAGKQAPVNLVLNHGWLLEDVAAKAAQFIEPDSNDLVNFFMMNVHQEFGYTTETLMSLFIPNTYEFSGIKMKRIFFREC